MILQRRFQRAHTYAQACVIGCCVSAAAAGQAMEGRPSLSGACQAWSSHIADLIDQHRRAREIDDNRLGDIIRLFREAQNACATAHYEEGIAIYETIPIGAVATRRLR
jgi:hypothetical protein